MSKKKKKKRIITGNSPPFSAAPITRKHYPHESPQRHIKLCHLPGNWRRSQRGGKVNEQFAAERCNTAQALALRPIITGCGFLSFFSPPSPLRPPLPPFPSAPLFSTQESERSRGERSLRWRAQESRFLSPRLLCTALSASQRKQKPSKTISYPHLSAERRASAQRN